MAKIHAIDCGLGERYGFSWDNIVLKDTVRTADHALTLMQRALNSVEYW